jgi:diguanylate cyclase (GGDEF)-like protein
MRIVGAVAVLRPRALGRPIPLFHGPERVWLVTTGLAVAAVVTATQWLAGLPALYSNSGLEWWSLAMAFALVEIFVVQLHFRRDAHSFSLSELPFAIGLFFLTPVQLVTAQLVGAGTALWLHRRQPLLKLAFNLANLAFSASVAMLLFRSILGGSDPLGPSGWLATFAAALASDLLTLVFIVVAITLSLGRPRDVRRLFGTGVAATFVNTSLALLAVTVISKYPAVSWLLFVLAAVLFLGYRAYGSLRQKHESLELLYAATKAIQQSLDVGPVTRALLEQARSMFRAEMAEIVLFTAEPGLATVSRLGPADDSVVAENVELDPTEGVWARVASEGRPICMPRPIPSEKLRSYFDEQGIRDAIVAPLFAGDAVIGTMTVANRQLPLNTFTSDDLQLFETLANHASVSLQNGRLVDRLRRQAEDNEYQALHDALTGLPNRRLFRDRLQEALAARASGGVAVAIMDLDRFKEVNDTLGHNNGDRLLQELAQRLSGVLGAEPTIARLSGDEFAILLPSGGRRAALRVSELILESLEQPFLVQDLQLHIGASIGIALYPDHGVDADTLIQRADVAMYLAKEAHAGCEVYAPSRDHYSPSRLALVAELRRSVENKELLVVYQPKASVRTGEIIGAEALVRWRHPRRGFVPPDEFISIAEHTGLIRPLTLHVMETAVRQCGLWRAAGLEMKVAVNISVRSLLDMDLADEIGRTLFNSGVPAEALQLEITESTIMNDAATNDILERLAAMGIGIAIDDFGTGYSSLAYLGRLPADEIKIDKSFVVNMATNENDAVIVRSTIDLGHNLGLRVVAEGVENRTVWEQLEALGCDVAQGYYLGRPMPGEQLTRQLLAASQRRIESAAQQEPVLRLVASADSPARRRRKRSTSAAGA